MSKSILIIFSILTVASIYLTYTGTGLQGVNTQDNSSYRSTRSGSRSNWGGSSYSYGK